MKNITKLLAVLVSSIMFVSNAVAGEMTVTGSAKASIRTGGEDRNSGKSIGVANELTVSASGELDNGYTWKYAVDLDEASTLNDDTQLTIGTPYGTIGFFASEGGLSTELKFGIGAMGTGADYANTMTNIGRGYDVSSDPHFAYHTPAGLLPFGIEAAIGYAPNTPDGQGNDYKSTGAVGDASADGTNATQYQITAKPIDGLSLAADYFTVGGTTGTNIQEDEAGGFAVAYQLGNIEVGYKERYYAPAINGNAPHIPQPVSPRKKSFKNSSFKLLIFFNIGL